MNNLKKFFLAISLTIILAGTALAECPQQNPGEQNGPPCVITQQVTDDSADQVTTGATAANAVEDAFIDAIIAGLEDLLTVY